MVVHHKVRVYVHALGIYVWAILHRNTPNLLSQGSLVKDEKYSYIHKHGKCPYLEKDGRKYYCPIRENTPVIVAGTDGGPAEGDVDLTSEPEQDSTSEPDGQPSVVGPKAKAKPTPRRESRKRKRLLAKITRRVRETKMLNLLRRL